MGPRYVLITPARNEEAYIARTAESVANQSVRPLRWIVVNDGSTDRTAEIIAAYAARYDFIRLVNVESGAQRCFSSKAAAFRLGLQELGGLDYDFIGNLDGDVSFETSYYEKMMQILSEDPRLGIVAGAIMDNVNGTYIKQISSPTHTPGAIQLFRRECFAQVGGYLPLRTGGVDSAAEIMAQMKGWQTRSFPQYEVLHHRRVGTGSQGLVRAKINAGLRDYHLGMHPLYMLVKTVYRLREPPWIWGSLLSFYGYFKAALLFDRRVVSEEFVRFVRRKEMKKIRGLMALPIGAIFKS